jgi:hypothetical protein
MNWRRKKTYCLCQLLLGNHDMLLLDEPTNHVDAVCGRMDGKMDGWKDGWMERWMDGKMDGNSRQ